MSVRGLARVTFLERQAEVMAELAAGWPVKAVYERHTDWFVGRISYSQFARYVGLARDGMPIAPVPKPAPMLPLKRRPKPADPPPPPETTTSREQPHGPAAGSRGFSHSPVPKPGEYDELLGPGWKPKG